ncbi:MULTISPECIES: ROK family transcriptional regulator [Bacillus]|uniref:ROK family transcriptional regulator n=1 Tax=Bacillus glycinifermentans TaxID=1664069 RepID=A0AAJ3Z2C4_9BACI|nr:MULTISPECIES: ROK family transcriptional regulator [Bacillus]KKB74046.1 ROK family transcriptional regulator [Bacillus sp. TH008]MBU8786200.1 ROK family transcriptional regulator [Bacillus glycinifermentans]MDU0070193.1 ROK family transcriptional regulator [Bacillus sp. IG6]MED8017873.1 ROK family transcriptional regulator [Bacillus glycinifermentans]NUJ16641.1 ROK family transcriptional regulator [Bacillus glycinifermentans]
MQRGTFQLMKSVNKSIILNKIRTSEPISRAQIAKETGITPPTVSSIVKELIEQGLVTESALGHSSGGRKPTMLHINSGAFYVIGVDAGPETVECILTDLTGEIFHRTSSLLKKPLTNEQFISILKENIYTILRLSNADQEKIIGIGIAMHGVVDVETGTSLVAPILHLTDVPIKEALEEEFGFTVKVENDARAMALGESWFGGHGDDGSMVAVNIGRGVGAGVVMNGKLYHGAHGIAGEFGHMIVDVNGDTCECGNRGCLQTVISGPAIAERGKKRITDSDARLTAKEIFDLAQNGSEACIDLFRETGRMIGIGLINLIHLVNPNKIVLGGGVMKSEKFMMPAILETIQQRALTAEAKQTKVAVTQLGDDATLLGAVSLLLIELFDPV